MKKVMSLIMSLVLLAVTSLSAAAAGTMNERLTAITLSVKETLGIGDSFTSFQGSLNENSAASLWSLSWTKDNEQIYVTANENGRIVSFSDYISGDSKPVYYGSRIPRFPAITIDEAKSLAKAFLDKVLNTKIETAELQGTANLDYSGSTTFYLHGSVRLYGIASPISVSVNVSAVQKKVTSFNRSDSGQDYSGIVKPSAATDMAAASSALKSTLNMKMTYALPGDGTHTARLQYLPNPNGSYVVDAATGKLIDLSKLDYSGDRTGFESKDQAAAPSAGPSGAGITEVEQSTIDKLQGVLSQAELENRVRAYAELGLTSDFKLRNMSYYTFEDESKATQVVASINFTSVPKDDNSSAQYRYISMNAKTGKLISVSSSRYYIDDKTPVASYPYTSGQTEAVARSFAGKILPEELKQTALTVMNPGSATDSARYYTFNRTHENITFPENYINVGVDAETGYVISFNSNWYSFDVSFVPSAGAISADTAAEKYAAGVGTALRYVGVPASTQTSGLLLAFTGADTSVWGVNAVTGELLKATVFEDESLSYSDLAGNQYAAKINQLAAYGIGFPGGVFKPNAQLTQEDALVLIESTNGRRVVPLTSPGSLDDLYSVAYSMGILTAAEKAPAKLISRAEFAKYLINALGYGDLAALKGIYKTGFSDDKAIPEALLGYVALAKGLGIIGGYPDGSFKPNDISTRTMAALMLYNCMSRK